MTESEKEKDLVKEVLFIGSGENASEKVIITDGVADGSDVVRDDGPLVGWWDAVNYWDDSFWTQNIECAWRKQQEIRVCGYGLCVCVFEITRVFSLLLLLRTLSFSLSFQSQESRRVHLNKGCPEFSPLSLTPSNSSPLPPPSSLSHSHSASQIAEKENLCEIELDVEEEKESTQGIGSGIMDINGITQTSVGVDERVTTQETQGVTLEMSNCLKRLKNEQDPSKWSSIFNGVLSSLPLLVLVAISLSIFISKSMTWLTPLCWFREYCLL